jgi:hypothetical protein
MKVINEKPIETIHLGERVIAKIMLGSKVIWEGIRSCFGKGYWINIKGCINTEGWRNK